jgi:hypothetical protein
MNAVSESCALVILGVRRALVNYSRVNACVHEAR